MFGNSLRATSVISVPIPLTQSPASPFPLQYYFELRRAGSAAIFPGLNADLANQPYFVLRQARSAAQLA